MGKKFKIILTSCIYLTLSCSLNNINKDKIGILKESVSTKSQLVTYDSIRHGNLFIIYPKLFNDFRNLISNEIDNEIKSEYCKKGGQTIVSYKVNHFTKNFISYGKHVEIECPNLPSDVVYDKGMNFLLFQDSLFEVKFTPSILEKREIMADIKNNVDPECYNLEKENLNFDNVEFVIDKGKLLLLNPLKSKVCNQSIEIEKFDFINFKFYYKKNSK